MKMLVTRMDFVEKWANLVKTYSAEKWSSMQKKLIDSQIKNARMVKLTKKQVDFIKGG